MLSLASGESMQGAVPHDCCGSSTAMCNRLMEHIWYATGLGGSCLVWASLLVELPAQSVCTKHYPILTLGWR